LNKIKYNFYSGISSAAHLFLPREKLKFSLEFLFWKFVKAKEKNLTNYHYENFFTSYFNLEKEFYKNKSVLDIGCGPRGTLEWIDNPLYRIGLDPLADKYIELGIGKHKMNYIKAYGESIPLKNNSFDIITSFNSLDHVSNPNKVINEVKRILMPGGLFLLITDVHDSPMLCEPSLIAWNFLDQFIRFFSIIEVNHYEGNNMWKSLRQGIEFNHLDKTKRNGILTAKLKKN
jgi:ubiquinone/menaquinone biosynthesis C-methylase UbiE